MGVGRRRGTFSEPDNPDRKQKRRSDHVSDNKGANAHRRCPVPYAAPSTISLGMGATISPSPRTSTNCMAVSVEEVESREERRTQHVFQDNHDCFPRTKSLNVSSPSLEQHVGIFTIRTFHAANIPSAPPPPLPPTKSARLSCFSTCSLAPAGAVTLHEGLAQRFCHLNICMASACLISSSTYSLLT